MIDQTKVQCKDCLQVSRLDEKVNLNHEKVEGLITRVTELEKIDSTTNAEMRGLFKVVVDIKDGIKELNTINRESLKELRDSHNSEMEKSEKLFNSALNEFNIRIRELEQKPGKHWDLVVTIIITAVVTAFVAYIIKI